MSKFALSLLSAVLCAAAILSGTSAQDGPFMLRVSRGTLQPDFTTRSRDVSLECLDLGTFDRDPIRDATFWLHDRENPEIRSPINNMVLINVERTQVTFRLEPDMEGNYSCGTQDLQRGTLRQSSPVLIVAAPISGLDLNPRTTFTQAGQTAMIPCGIPAGRAREQYRIRWMNETRGPIIAQLLFPRETEDQGNSQQSRFSVSPENFSLIIDNVEVGDAGNFYRCVVDVFFASNLGPFEYPQTFSLPLKLTVYESPAIIVPPKSQTLTTTQRSTARFDCSARGVPAPTITWIHNTTTARNGTKYRINSTTTAGSDGNSITNSVLEILDLRSRDSGLVKCKAGVAPDEEIDDQILPTAIQKVELIVLGGFKSIDVLVSPDKAVIINIVLEVAIPQMVHVFLNYTDEENRLSYQNRTSTAGYSNAKSITHVEPQFQVPFNRFRVSVGIVVGGIVSPLRDQMRPFDINEPSDTSELIKDTVTIAAAATVPCFIILVIMVSLCVICCIVFVYKHKESSEHKIKKLTVELSAMLTKTDLNEETRKDILLKITYRAFDHIKPPATRKRDHGAVLADDDGEAGMSLEDLASCECDLLVSFIKDSLEQGLRNEKIGADLKRCVEGVLRAYEEELQRTNEGDENNGHVYTTVELSGVVPDGNYM